MLEYMLPLAPLAKAKIIIADGILNNCPFKNKSNVDMNLLARNAVIRRHKGDFIMSASIFMFFLPTYMILFEYEDFNPDVVYRQNTFFTHYEEVISQERVAELEVIQEVSIIHLKQVFHLF
jgi:hypothetical protein